MQLLSRHEFVKSVDVWTRMLGFGGKMIQSVRRAELAQWPAHRGAGNAMTLRPIAVCSAMLDVKTVDLKDDSEGESSTVLVQASWRGQQLRSQR